MASRFVQVDHDTPLLFPPDMRKWVPEDHMIHFVMDAVEQLDLRRAQVNHRGTGSLQYPPSMVPGLPAFLAAWQSKGRPRMDPRLPRLQHAKTPPGPLKSKNHPANRVKAFPPTDSGQVFDFYLSDCA